MIHTYRFRLTIYTIGLLVFLTGTLSLTYIYTRGVILTQAEESANATAQVLQANLELEEKELVHYTEIVRDDIRVKEYLFMIAKVGTDSSALETLYKRQFGWLPVENHLIISNSGEIISGNKNSTLAPALIKHSQNSNEEVFYYNGANGMELVSWAPVIYQNTSLGLVALTHLLNNRWLENIRERSGGFLFLVEQEKVLISSLKQAINKRFVTDEKGRAHVDGNVYRVNRIGPRMVSTAPQIWYGVSEQDLLEGLGRLTRFVLLVIFAGSLAVFGMGLAIFRNFSSPLNQLMRMTKAVAKGEFPNMDKSVLKNEIGELSNMFVEMLAALRHKQAEIDRIHKELEESAITDALTSLYNRRYLQEVFPKVLSQAQREKQYLTGILLDLDHFKQINDRYGHLGGDQCLTQVAQLLRDISRANDYVFRIGGEEFFILSSTEMNNGGMVLAEKIRESIEAHEVHYKDLIIPLTASIGVAIAKLDLPSDKALTYLLFHSDKAMYQAKVNGRNQIKMQSAVDAGDETRDAS
ncbi:MAG: diguanylate cyclase [Gammaproteobacteria bacterium]|nr:diguanylate cyclase [Gammaproteobacteria bacterium]MDH5801983.1 diguanylate cyclase [Gammaproteobacteria bacterium]